MSATSQQTAYHGLRQSAIVSHEAKDDKAAFFSPLAPLARACHRDEQQDGVRGADQEDGIKSSQHRTHASTASSFSLFAHADRVTSASLFPGYQNDGGELLDASSKSLPRVDTPAQTARVANDDSLDKGTDNSESVNLRLSDSPVPSFP